MPARSIASATISFGLVSIPVRIHPATQPSGSVSFHLLHAKCGSRLKQQYVCPLDGERVERDDMVKGYEVEKERWVTFTAEELKALDELASQTIDIAEFVPAAEVDPVYFDRAYHLSPDEGAAKAYRLLAVALERSGKAALARYAARGKQYLVLVRARAGRLVMQQLLYAQEVRPVDEVPVPDVEVKDAEVDLALRLVEQTSSDRFQPERYEDAVRGRILEAIARKAEGGQIEAPAEAPETRVIDLVEALKASLAAKRDARGGGAPEAPAPGRKPPKRVRPGEARAKASGRK